MADLVARKMEEMIPELEELQTLQLFSEAEIKKIVKSRSDFEYLMQRKSPNKLDFLRYIEYEMNLDLLRKARKRRLDIVKMYPTDHTCTKRVSSIYHRCLLRFSGDLSLWSEYLDYLESQGSFKSLQRAFPRALQLHPREPRLWGKAAAVEFMHNKDVAAARVLMQRQVDPLGKCDENGREYHLCVHIH
mmetsp:Transcript_39559/g.63474  ORF Transcript_39559/g.63474 Transcript_39559/m.63474 type:complete len:189 (+) Transcript_39559:85-651(+)